MTESERNSEAIRDAAAWHIRLQGGALSPGERRALDEWRRRSAAHEAALAEADRVWNDLSGLAGMPGARARLLEDAAPEPGRTPDVVHLPARVAPRRHRVWQALVASVLLVAAGLGFVAAGGPAFDLRTALHAAFLADHSTAPGEVRTVALSDGSTVELNTATAIRIAYDGQRRAVELLAGEAVFGVAAAASSGGRPFVVLAGGGTVRALGTKFLVRTRGDRVEVAVLEHSVAVTPPNAVPANGGAQGSVQGSPGTPVLRAGQAAGYGRAGGLGPVGAVDPGRAAPWRSGTLVFDRVPVSEAVSEINRYRRDRIVVMDSAIARRSVSGVFRLDDLDGAIRTMAGELGARTVAFPFLVTALY